MTADLGPAHPVSRCRSPLDGYPKTALAGTGAGIIAGAVTLPAFKAAQGAGILERAVANAGIGAIYGGAAEGFDKKTLRDTAIGGAIGGAAGGIGGYVIEKATPVVLGLFRKGIPLRSSDGQLTGHASEALRGAGIDPSDPRRSLRLG